MAFHCRCFLCIVDSSDRHHPPLLLRTGCWYAMSRLRIDQNVHQYAFFGLSVGILLQSGNVYSVLCVECDRALMYLGKRERCNPAKSIMAPVLAVCFGSIAVWISQEFYIILHFMIFLSKKIDILCRFMYNYVIIY